MKKEKKETPIIVNLEPSKDKKRISELTGIFHKNYEVKCLREAFPDRVRMWYVEVFWEWQKIYIDQAYCEDDKADIELKRKVMEKNKLDYRVM